MPNTNWRAMRVPAYQPGRGQLPTWDRPGDVIPRHLSMGSWASRHLRHMRGASTKAKGKPRMKMHKLPSSIPMRGNGEVIL